MMNSTRDGSHDGRETYLFFKEIKILKEIGAMTIKRESNLVIDVIGLSKSIYTYLFTYLLTNLHKSRNIYLQRTLKSLTKRYTPKPEEIN